MNGKKNILAVDIGASKTNLGIFPVNESPRMPIKEASLVTKDFANASNLLQHFLNECSIDIAQNAVVGNDLRIDIEVKPVDRGGVSGEMRRPSYSALANTKATELGITLPH